MIPQAEQIYKHFKGNLYRILTMAEHTETGEQLVIYQALYGEYKVYARPLSMFMEEVDRIKYPQSTQKYRFELFQPLAQPLKNDQNVEFEKNTVRNAATTDNVLEEALETETGVETKAEEFSLDPLLEAYLDTDSYRERLNILRGLRHKITENMLTTMSIVIDFELPEGSLEEKYEALQDCLVTKEKYECHRMG